MDDHPQNADSICTNDENATSKERSTVQSNDGGASQTADRVFLTSRRNKKHVRIPDGRSKCFNEAHLFVDEFEDTMKEGIDGIHSLIAGLESERSKMEAHIAHLEESLHGVNAEREQREGSQRKMLQEIGTLKTSNQELEREIHQINNSHDKHLYLIADRHRKTRLAHKTLHKWKGKLRSTEKVCILEEENRRLRKELLACQDGAKKAFLRSANKLNSEALSMFQDSSRRQIDARLLPSTQDRDIIDSSSASITSEASFPSSGGSCEGTNRLRSHAEALASPPTNNDRRRIISSRCESESRHKRQHDFSSDSEGHSSRHDENVPYNSESYRTAHKRKSPINTFGSAEKQRDGTQVRHLPSYIPDPLRKETRQLVKQFQTSKPIQQSQIDSMRKDPKWELCPASHVHVCHCSPIQGFPGKCPSCSPGQNYNLSNMPIDDRASPLRPFNRPKTVKCTGSNVSMKKNVAFASTSKNEGRKSVFYKPTGSTVVIEKHFSS